MQATEARAPAVTREMFYNEALGDALRLEMERDERVIVIGEDIAEHGGAFQVTAGLLDKFGPTRIRQTPISEIGIVGAAVGAALTGLRPVVELMYVDFAGLAMDQIVNQAAQNRFMFGGQARAVVTWSREVLCSLDAAAKLADDGSAAEVVDVRTLVPLDRETILGSVRKTHRLLVVHEAIKRGGYGAEIAAFVAEEAFDDLDAPPKRLAGLETPIPYAQHLERSVVPQVDDIVSAAKELVG